MANRVVSQFGLADVRQIHFGLLEPLNVPRAGAGVVHDPVISRPVELIVPLKDASTGPLLAQRQVTTSSIT